MVKVENIETSGWQAAIRGMRNPKNSWDKSDSNWGFDENGVFHEIILGPNDLDLACRLIKAGPEHRKFLRMIHIQMDITSPMFWWSEFDTYKVATTRDSCSKMHKIHTKFFQLSDFACEGCDEVPYAMDVLEDVLDICERLRNDYNKTNDRKYWRALIELLPESYLMKATWDGSLETVLSILHQRDHHKLKEEWEPFRQECFDNIPYCKEFYEALYGKEENNAYFEI